jgi:hypothetical protein
VDNLHVGIDFHRSKTNSSIYMDVFVCGPCSVYYARWSTRAKAGIKVQVLEASSICSLDKYLVALATLSTESGENEMGVRT